MYVNRIEIANFRTFRKAGIDFVHPDQDFGRMAVQAPALKNVNLLLGNNGSGKTTLLKALALACLGPAVGRSGIYPYRLIRRDPAPKTPAPQIRRSSATKAEAPTRITAGFCPHHQDGVAAGRAIESSLSIVQQGDLESLEWTGGEDESWNSIFSEDSDAFFFVGYGANRRVERPQQMDFGSRKSRVFIRAQRVQSLFEETYSLIPLNAWLPEYQSRNKGRYTQVVHLMNRLMGKGHYEFTGTQEQGEYLFSRGGLKVPFPALSDGYRAYLGWVGDLLYHICMTCPRGRKLVDNKGIVMVDEIDLHLHPAWQISVLPTLAAALPNIQFIVTSHSPLIVGSLDWANIVVMTAERRQASGMKRIEAAVNGLDADQILLTEFFGLDSTRSLGAARTLKELTLKARSGDPEAAKQLLKHMATGSGITR